VEQFKEYLRSLDLGLDFDPEVLSSPDSPLAQPFISNSMKIGNRFCIQPMEGWDGDRNGKPTDLTLRRWRRFGQSGAKLIWGGEAVAVLPEGRANPNQLLINSDNFPELVGLRESLVEAHAVRWQTNDLYIGLQLTHSGRFSRPNDRYKLEPLILYSHPILNRKFKLPDDYPILSDGEIARIIEATVKAAMLAQKAGFHFVDLKHCHGYLGHEFLSAGTRSGQYGGSFENRTRYLRSQGGWLPGSVLSTPLFLEPRCAPIEPGAPRTKGKIFLPIFLASECGRAGPGSDRPWFSERLDLPDGA
jgi:2,4-dienoyl-CoA reductase-like NADH-dependent reductase (Old Yellow Enzyme family)